MFEATDHDRHQQTIQSLVRILFMLMTGLLILPVIIIMILLIIRGWPAISLEFLFGYPENGMTAGGIFPAL